MPTLDDPVIDEIRDISGKLFGPTPTQGWLRPRRVTLRTPRQLTLGDLFERPFRTDLPDLEFVLYSPWSEPPPGARKARPGGQILEEFLCLASAPDERICDFASRFGPLLVFYEIGGDASGDDRVIVESCEVWRYFAACMGALLRMAVSYHLRRAPNPADWDIIGYCPSATKRAKEGAHDWLNPSPVGGEKAWNAMAHFVRKGSDRDRKMWVRLLNALLDLGRVRPWVLWEGPGVATRPQLVFSGPNLLSYLALQLCLLASKQDAFAVCSHCQRQYVPTKRAPKAGQRNFCRECRVAGVPVRLAQRARRERSRAKA